MKTSSIFRLFGGIALLLGFMAQGMAQSEDYQSFFDGNPVYTQLWNMYEYKWEAGMTIKKHSLEGDTTVDGISYHILSVVGAGGERENDYSVRFWVRESEAHDKVWVRLPWDGEGREFLAVDMNLQPGVLFPIGTPSDTVYYEVDTVYYMEHVGGNLKHIRLKPTTDSSWMQALYEVGQLPKWRDKCDWRSYHLEFIEGVGSNLGFVYYRLGLFDENEDVLWNPLCPEEYRLCSYRRPLMPYDYIVCMERNGAAYYEHPNAECMACTDKSVRFDEVIYDEGDPSDTNGRMPPANERVQSMSRHLQISPNPAAATATLQWDAATDSRVSMAACNILLYDMQGVRLRSYVVDRWPYTLSVSDWTPGAYLLRVTPSEAPADGAWQATVRLMVR
ncbi:MAG: T9SS type A sorting domain-containing protein [Bacteroidales bacterium]|nr:T9SS type A sorting domain-containing protein [Bacteroidales bacterium]